MCTLKKKPDPGSMDESTLQRKENVETIHKKMVKEN